MAGQDLRRFLLCTAAGLALAGCVEGTGTGTTALTADGQPIVDATVNAPTSVKLVDRDVEDPKVFSAEGPALWDGRPSLGGVWVASPDAKDPERVIMRNEANGKFVIGALFKREELNPGPKLQISSDAADALGILAGDPTAITVTALRREEAPPPTTDANAPLLTSAETVGGADVAADAAKAIDAAPAPATAASTVTTTPTTTATDTTGATDTTADATTAAPAKTGFLAGLASAFKNPNAGGTSAAATAPLTAVEPAATAAAVPPVTPPPVKPAASGPSIQVGTFSVEANAQRAVDILKKVGIAATIHTGQASGKQYWYVTVSGNSATLASVKAAGFTDAYLVGK